MSKMLTFSLMLVALVTGLGLGYFFSPYYMPYTQVTAMESHFGTADRWVDLRYINQMIAHHRGAILMAQNIENKTDRTEIKDLAADIQKSEPKLIEKLYSWKRDWYKDYSSVRDPIVSDFGSKDATSDLRFLNAVIAHHEEGVSMTKEIRAKSSRSDIINDADAVEKFLTDTKVVFRSWRKDWYQVQ